MVEVSTRFGSGHLQIQHPEYNENPRMERIVPYATELREQILQVQGVTHVSNRSEAFALVSNEERSVGALVLGVDPSIDSEVAYFSQHITEGTYLASDEHAYIGSALARNLDLSLNDEIVVLSTDIEGSVAALALLVGGIFETGNDGLDRSILQITRTAFNDAMRLDDGAHRVVIMVANPMDLAPTKQALQQLLPENTRLYDWHTLMPEVNQSIDLDKVSNAIVYGTLTLIVVLSIANTFVMTMFERTREFGVLKAVGMRNNSLFSMFLTESMLLWLLGVVVGCILSICVIIPMSITGISIGEMGMEDFAAMFFLPDRIHPRIDLNVALVAPISLGCGIVLTTALASVRLYRMSLIEALWYKE